MATGSEEPMVDREQTPMPGSTSDPKDGCFGRKKRRHHHDHRQPHPPKHGAAAADVEIQNARRRRRPKKKDPLTQGLANQSPKNKNEKFRYLVSLKKGTPIATITSNDVITKLITAAKGSGGVLAKIPGKMAGRSVKAITDGNGLSMPSTSAAAQPDGGMRKATAKTNPRRLARRRTAKPSPFAVGLPIHINLSMIHPTPMAAPVAVAM